MLLPPCPAPSEQQHAMGFPHRSAPAILCCLRARGALCSGRCHPWRLCKPRLLWHGQQPPEQGGVSSSCPGSPGQWPARGDALCCSQEPPQGLCLCSACACQLCFASPRPRFSLACSEPILEKEQESLAGWVLCNIKPKCECGEGRAQLMSSIHGACTAVCRAKTLLRHCRLFLSIIYSAYLALSSP